MKDFVASMDKVAHAFEEKFFSQSDHEKLKALQEKIAKENEIASLRKQLGDVDNQVLETFLKKNLTSKNIAGLLFFPLIVVAWADETLDQKEKKAILESLKSCSIDNQSMTFALIQSWLENRPTQDLEKLWESYIDGIFASMSVDEKKVFIWPPWRE
ncbi:MAG: hypothetical protein R3A11_02785 [Bdellovibrionota bacterium]